MIAAVASYLLGDSVKQFSIIIGIYLSALGLGAYLSRFVDRRLAATFVDVELAAALLGGLSAPALFVAFAFTSSFALILYGFVVAVGALVGLELPLLIRILQREVEFKDLIAKALTFDYAGALVGSIAFSLLLVPHLGLVNTSIACGLLNACVGLASTWLLPTDDETEVRSLAGGRARAVVVTLLLLVAMLQAGRVEQWTEASLYSDPIVVAERSRYQRIVVTEKNGRVRLYLNGNLQFASADEHRYHEALVHPAMSAARHRRRVLIGGGGDGLAAREVLKWPDVETVTLVDLDARITGLAQENELLTNLNENALGDPRVTVVNDDAMIWMSRGSDRFDVVILDFPDPSNYSLGKLYSSRFYRSVKRRLEADGALAVQSTSPMFARSAYWCVVETLDSIGFHTRPYHVFVPSFGEWGYVLAGLEADPKPDELPEALRYLDHETLAAMFEIPADMQRLPVEPNRLNNQAVVGYYLAAWSRWQ